MQSRQNILSVLSTYKQSYAKKYGIKDLGLFGSVARNEHTETSDVDVCVRLSNADFFARMSIKEDLENILQCPVDVISLGATMRPLFKQQLQQDVIFV